MKIIGEISFFLFYVDDPACHEKLCAGIMQKLTKTVNDFWSLDVWLGSKQASGSYRQPCYFSNLETFKVEKNLSSTRESDMNWLTNKMTKMLYLDLSYFLSQ